MGPEDPGPQRIRGHRRAQSRRKASFRRLAATERAEEGLPGKSHIDRAPQGEEPGNAADGFEALLGPFRESDPRIDRDPLARDAVRFREPQALLQEGARVLSD